MQKNPNTMSQEYIQFMLPHRYFQPSYTQNGMRRETCITLLTEVFGLCDADWNRLMCEYSDGIRIRCRPDQFARFIVRRYDTNECINGVKDLEPKIIMPTKPVTLYDQAARLFGQSHFFIQETMEKLGVEDRALDRPQNFTDVSKNSSTMWFDDDIFNNQVNFRRLGDDL